MPVESKSGGLHLYLFMNEFVQSTIIVSFLSNLLPIFNLKPDCEIFPKQTQLTKDPETGIMKPGQFINLPYYGTERKAVNIDGTFFTLEQFIKVAFLREMKVMGKGYASPISFEVDLKSNLSNFFKNIACSKIL